MKELTFFTVLTFVFAYTVGQFGIYDDFKQRAETVHNYEYKALEFSRQVRHLKIKNEKLKAKISRLESEIEHMKMNTSKKKSLKRTIASVSPTSKMDLVEFDLYQWGPDKLLGVAQQALHFKKYEKAAQFYNALIHYYPKDKSINDRILFEAGIAAYESKKHFDWAKNHFSKLVKVYPKSKFYRGSKLWLGLSHFHQGDRKEFLATVNEFRKKYRNTREWKVLSRYYEELNYKYQK